MTPTKRRVLNISAVVAIFGVALALGAGLLHAGRGMSQVQGNSDRLGVQELKVDDLESIMIQTHTIVSRIDKRMDREHP